MKKRVKFFFVIAAIFTLCWLSLSADADTLIMPGNLLEIEPEAFQGDISLDEVSLSDGIRSIGSKAFADTSLNRIFLPESLNAIAADAFENSPQAVLYMKYCDYPYQYAKQHLLPYVCESEEVYSFSDFLMDDTGLKALFSTEDACVLSCSILTDDRNAVVLSEEIVIPAGLQDETVLLFEKEALPDYFALRAKLHTTDGHSLSDEFTSIEFTEAYRQFSEQTVDDFSEKIVIDYGSGGYCVLVDQALVIDAVAAQTSYGVFEYTGDVAPDTGSVVLLDVAGRGQLAVKVASASVQENGKICLAADQGAQLSELFQSMRLNMSIPVSAADTSSTVADANQTLTLIDLELLTIKAELTPSVNFSLDWDPKFFGEGYLDLYQTVELKGSITSTFRGAYDTTKLKDAFGQSTTPELVIYDGPIAVLGPFLATAQLRITVPLDFYIGAEGNASIGIDGEWGYSYNTYFGRERINKWKPTYDINAKGKIELKLGPKVKLSVNTTFLEGGVEGHFGMKLSSEIKHDIDDLTADKRHACQLCTDINLSWFAELEASLGYEISSKLKGDLFRFPILSDKEIPIATGFLSLINDPESIYGGKPHLGWDKCQNFKYMASFSTENKDHAKVENIPVRVSNDGNDNIASGNSPLTVWLYPGDYEATATFENDRGKKEFDISDEAVEVLITEGSDEFTYRYNDTNHTATITGYKGKKASPVIPDTSPYGYPVTAIGNSAFAKNSYITTINIPAGVTVIDQSVFYECPNLETVILPDGISTISYSTFYRCKKLTNVVFPSTLKEIYSSAFKECGSGAENTFYFNLPDGIESIDSSAFTDCPAIRICGKYSLTAKSLSAAGYSFRCHGELDWLYRYMSNKLWLMKYYGHENAPVIPEGVEAIYFRAFAENTFIKTINIPAEVTVIDQSVFYECPNLETIILPDGISTISYSTFYRCKKLTNVVFPSALKEIYSSAFKECGSDAENTFYFNLPDGIESIDSSAFTDCPAIRICGKYSLTAKSLSAAGYSFRCHGELDWLYRYMSNKLWLMKYYGHENAPVIPEGVEAIYFRAFAENTFIKTINIPAEVTVIDQSVFYECPNLETIILPDGISTISYSTFYRCKKLTNVVFPSALKEIYSSAFKECGSDAENTFYFNLPDGIESIDSSAFTDCPAIRICGKYSLTAKSLSAAGYSFRCHGELDWLYRYMSNKLWLMKYYGHENAPVIPEGVEAIYFRAFAENTFIKTINIPAEVTVIDQSVFYECTNLESVSFPYTLTSIGTSAFYGNKSLQHISIPSSVTDLGSGVFSHCDNLESVFLPTGLTSIPAYLCSNCPKLSFVSVPDTVTSIAGYAFSDCGTGNDFAMTVRLPDGITFIGYLAFSGNIAVYARNPSETWTTLSKAWSSISCSIYEIQ